MIDLGPGLNNASVMANTEPPQGPSSEVAAPSKCPVHFGSKLNDPSQGNNPNNSFWNQIWGKNTTDPSSFSSTIPPSVEAAAEYAQTPQPDQRIHLSTQRQVSTIPRGDKAESSEALPVHQAGTTSDGSNWVYPSEQQMYNAMRRKGWSNIPEESIPMVLQIHNGINEKTWKQVMDWEGTSDLTLARFHGRPKDLSPKAFFWTKLLPLYDSPFDRHDWYVQRNDPNPVVQRYVIDYYYLRDRNDENAIPVPFIDARPALDHPRAVGLHLSRFVTSAFPGFAAYWRRYQEYESNRKKQLMEQQDIRSSKTE